MIRLSSLLLAGESCTQLVKCLTVSVEVVPGLARKKEMTTSSGILPWGGYSSAPGTAAGFLVFLIFFFAGASPGADPEAGEE